MSSRPDIELVLDVRSYERVVVFTDPGSTERYPERWEVIRGKTVPDWVDEMTVVIVDRIEPTCRTIEMIGSRRPRILALVPADRDQEKLMRRNLRAVYPWAEPWDEHTTFGKVLYTAGAQGLPYDREAIGVE